MLETERARMTAPIQYEELISQYDPYIIERASAIHDSYII